MLPVALPNPLDDPAAFAAGLAAIQGSSTAKPHNRQLAIAQFGKALAVTCINCGVSPGPDFIRECARLAREYYEEIDNPTPRPQPKQEEED